MLRTSLQSFGMSNSAFTTRLIRGLYFANGSQVQHLLNDGRV